MKFKNILRMLMVTMLSATMIGCSNDKKDVVVNNDEDVVVATSVAVTEILDALGVKVSGVPTTSYELPESTKEAVEVGNPMSPDLEIIKSLNPSVVVSVDTLGADYKKLFTDNNIPSEFVSLSSLEGLKETVSNLGNKFNKQAEAEAILKELNTKEEEMASISEKEKTNIIASITRREKLLANENYVNKAPSNVVESERNNLAKEKEKLLDLEDKIKKYKETCNS